MVPPGEGVGWGLDSFPAPLKALPPAAPCLTKATIKALPPRWVSVCALGRSCRRLGSCPPPDWGGVCWKRPLDLGKDRCQSQRRWAKGPVPTAMGLSSRHGKPPVISPSSMLDKLQFSLLESGISIPKAQQGLNLDTRFSPSATTGDLGQVTPL